MATRVGGTRYWGVRTESSYIFDAPAAPHWVGKYSSSEGLTQQGLYQGTMILNDKSITKVFLTHGALSLFDGLVGHQLQGLHHRTAGSQFFEPGRSGPGSSPEGQRSLLHQKGWRMNWWKAVKVRLNRTFAPLHFYPMGPGLDSDRISSRLRRPISDHDVGDQVVFFWKRGLSDRMG